MAIIASEAWQSVGLMKKSLKVLIRKLTDWFNETTIRFTGNDNHLYIFILRS